MSLFDPGEKFLLVDKQKTIDRLKDHLIMLTQTIGERSVRVPGNLAQAADYIEAQMEAMALAVQRQPYRFRNFEVCNVVARLHASENPSRHYVLGAHYDSVAGTVGADDNASAVAVLLETARAVKALENAGRRLPAVTFIAFTLEEPPAFGTRHMGSRVFANQAKKSGMVIDGMICLEMVGYTCRAAGCQHYPFPLRFMGYPKEGTFIGIVGNGKSRPFTRNLRNCFQRNPNLPVISLTVPLSGWLLPAVRLSDHAPFWDKGYRAVMLTDTAFFRNPHYHRPSDTMQTLDFGFMAEVVESLVGFLGFPEVVD
jgi:hypothetical protein